MNKHLLFLLVIVLPIAATAGPFELPGKVLGVSSYFRHSAGPTAPILRRSAIQVRDDKYFPLASDRREDAGCSRMERSSSYGGAFPRLRRIANVAARRVYLP